MVYLCKPILILNVSVSINALLIVHARIQMYPKGWMLLVNSKCNWKNVCAYVHLYATLCTCLHVSPPTMCMHTNRALARARVWRFVLAFRSCYNQTRSSFQPRIIHLHPYMCYQYVHGFLPFDLRPYQNTSRNRQEGHLHCLANFATLEKSRHFGASCLATTHKHSRNIARKIPSRSAIFLKCREVSSEVS